MSGLFLGSEALADGRVTRYDLRRRYVKLHHNVYAPVGMELSACDRAVAAWLWSGRRATVAGLSAAAMHGSRWLPDTAPAELTRMRCGSPPGIAIHRDTLFDDEVCLVRSIDCTTVARTVFDLGRRIPGDEAIIRIDALLNATRLPVSQVSALASRHPGVRGLRRLRTVLSRVDGGAESPQETRLRLVLVRGGLPPPVTQVPVTDSRGRVVRRIDLGWPSYRVGVEYDGGQHWTDPRAHAEDIGRLEFLAGRGWIIVRVSARHLRDADDILLRVEQALRRRGWPGPPRVHEH
ncbi:hypothetical protein KUF57_16300 [Mycolicibacterium sp. PAM1]|uniref:hypothetical protein n=1 Tax=Mycolicibacterium sp. PAM1 TaxID=2853535 RepID=UPI001C3DBC5D|nr:hypothetical protein [Mycolicibacterium sp. PAM1]MBV5245104.1 hypothetical protein [Mycolicibacterium sp. PAM1]